jgi:hypothetical protein
MQAITTSPALESINPAALDDVTGGCHGGCAKAQSNSVANSYNTINNYYGAPTPPADPAPAVAVAAASPLRADTSVSVSYA